MVRLNMIINCPVTFDDVKNAKLVFGSDTTSLKGKAVRRKPQLIPNRLYYFDITDRENSVLLINSVSENREGFTLRVYKGAWEAQQAMHLLGFLSEQYIENMVRLNMIINCPVTFEDVKNAKLIFGPDTTLLKGKSVRRKPASVVTD